MFSSFTIQLALWLLLAISSLWLLVQVLQFRRLASRLPKACHLENLEAKIARNEELLADIEKHGSLKAILNSFEISASQAKADLEHRQALLAEIQERIKAGETKLEQIQTAERESRLRISTFQTERDALQAQIETLKAIADKTADKMGRPAPQDKYNDLWKPVFNKRLSQSEPIAEEKALAMTEAHLKSLGLQFPRRVLHAYHTALKTADLSPIAVLAGISGTGKSELPKRYAEGMGIQFVGLPVQPRWDSPTDLFGFFNHLEGRFKATELARAMVQFERHNRGRWTQLPKDWNEGLENNMLLVLLDEMNLARVEYYFSDFLSRLETRRGVNLGNADDRAKAELAIDMGSLDKTETPITFFPDRNVLFTGTMNEDESTQSLSDKVLDRACVLRFGRPLTLATTKAMSKGLPRDKALSFANWNEWLAAGRTEDISTAISDLNSAMEKMGRPFGHRVAQAMQAYVNLYPTWAPDRAKLALADQIEQRILPKLRGMDTSQSSDAFKTIERIIQDTGDEVLLNAFKSGKTQPSFHWQGIDRT